jgi:hypothetical protein
MVPKSIRRQLNRLRRRERALAFSWSAACGLALCAILLALACLTDWLIDRQRDTPLALRGGLLAAQALVWASVLVFVLRAVVRRLGYETLALWVEERFPTLGHRLISAVQLNQAGARTQGMSPELIAALTRQAEEEARKVAFSQVVDGRRLDRALALLAALVLPGVVLWLLAPHTVSALLARQVLQERVIPRSVRLETASAEVQPAGEEAVLRFRVVGAGRGTVGEVRVQPEEGSASRHELVYEGPTGDGAATFVARVPPAEGGFAYRAWLGDGRLRRPGAVRLEPRPVVRRIEAWVRLPASLGVRQSGLPFEEAQKGGDIVRRLRGSRGRIAVTVQKPIRSALLELLGPAGVQGEAVRRRVPLTVGGDGSRAEGVFDFRAGETAYRVVVRDRHGFENVERPRRTIRTGTVPAPQVVLLPETMWRPGDPGTPEEREIEGIPVLRGERFRLDYRCAARYGLSHARLRYRVILRTSSSAESDSPPVTEEEFQHKFPFKLDLGAPPGSTARASAEFATLPGRDPDRLGGTIGGGRYDFQTRGIPDGKGGLLQLRAGDRIQFYVEVFGKDEPDRRAGRSVVREKEVVNLKEFQAWLERKEDLKDRTRQLEQRQRRSRPEGGGPR